MSKSEIISANITDLVKGGFGATSVMLASAMSSHEALEFWLRCILHLSGIACAIVTIWSIVHRTKRG